MTTYSDKHGEIVEGDRFIYDHSHGSRVREVTATYSNKHRGLVLKFDNGKTMGIQMCLDEKSIKRIIKLETETEK